LPLKFNLHRYTGVTLAGMAGVSVVGLRELESSCPITHNL
jgi:hypothetical protein